MWTLFLNSSWFKPIALLAAVIGLLGFGYYTGDRRATIAYELEKQTAIAKAEESVIIKHDKADTITGGITNDYEKKSGITNGLYGVDGLRKSALPNNLPPLAGTTGGTQPQQFSKQYHLSFKQCDALKDKADSFWDWYAQQRSNYNGQP